MHTRQAQLLKLVVKNHIKTAEPVGSKFLVAQGLNWGEATVRNELRALEDDGYLTHPHTSAGRVPTVKGYKYFINNLDLDGAKIGKKESAILEEAGMGSVDAEDARKNLAKAVAELSNAAVLLAFSPNRVYYTGLSNLFHQPEFKEINVVVDVSAMFDHCEDCLSDFLEQTENEIKFFIGDEHPFGGLLSAAAFRFGDNGLFSLIGPLRMNYERNFGIMKKVRAMV